MGLWHGPWAPVGLDLALSFPRALPAIPRECVALALLPSCLSTGPSPPCLSPVSHPELCCWWCALGHQLCQPAGGILNSPQLLPAGAEPLLDIRVQNSQAGLVPHRPSKGALELLTCLHCLHAARQAGTRTQTAHVGWTQAQSSREHWSPHLTFPPTAGPRDRHSPGRVGDCPREVWGPSSAPRKMGSQGSPHPDSGARSPGYASIPQTAGSWDPHRHLSVHTRALSVHTKEDTVHKIFFLSVVSL